MFVALQQFADAKRQRRLEKEKLQHTSDLASAESEKEAQVCLLDRM